MMPLSRSENLGSISKFMKKIREFKKTTIRDHTGFVSRMAVCAPHLFLIVKTFRRNVLRNRVFQRDTTPAEFEFINSFSPKILEELLFRDGL